MFGEEGWEGSCGRDGGWRKGWARCCEKTDVKPALNRRESDLKATVKRPKATVNRRESDMEATEVGERVGAWAFRRVGVGRGRAEGARVRLGGKSESMRTPFFG